VGLTAGDESAASGPMVRARELGSRRHGEGRPLASRNDDADFVVVRDIEKGTGTLDCGRVPDIGPAKGHGRGSKLDGSVVETCGGQDVEGEGGANRYRNRIRPSTKGKVIQTLSKL